MIVSKAEFWNIVWHINKVNEVDLVKVVVCGRFGASNFICKLRSEFAYNDRFIKAILDQLNEVVVDFYIDGCYFFIVVSLIIYISFQF